MSDPAGPRRLTALALAALLGATGLAALEVPFLTGRINDQADLLPSEAEVRIAGISEVLEQQTGAQVVVLTIPSLEDENLEDFSIRVAEQWKLGRKGVDDGVLLLVSRDDRKLRLEVGYGLEGALPDVTAHRIIDEVIVPEFRRGDFESGIEAGVRAVAQVVRGEELPPPPERPRGGGSGPDVFAWVFMALLIMSGGLRSAVGRKPIRALIVGLVGALLIGGGVGLAVSFLMGLLAVGVWMFFVLLFFALPVPTRRGGRGGGWISSGGGGGFSGGGGGFSGGGGSFGGGGASGSW